MSENRKNSWHTAREKVDKIQTFRKQSQIRRALCIYILLSIFCIEAKTERQKLIFEGITNDKGLTHNTVYDICQDTKGFMWFATEGGLNRYDGQHITQYYSQKNKHSLPANSIPCIISTSDGKLFVGTSNGLVLYHPETDDFSEIFYNGKGMGKVIAMQQGDEGELLISTVNKGAYIYYYNKYKIKLLNFLKERIFGMTKDKEGKYWAFSRFELYRFNQQNRIISQFHVEPNLFKSAISYIKSDKKGVMWVGTFENGLFTYNFEKHIFTPFISSNKVDIYYVRTIEEGENPNEYWVGTEKGLYVLNVKEGYFDHYIQSFDYNLKTINDNAIYKIYRNRQNVFFVGTYFGGVNIVKTRHIGFNAIFPDDKANCLHGKALGVMAKAPDGKLWIATEDAGIAVYDKKNEIFSHIVSDRKDINTLSTNNIHALLMDENTCWVGHFMGGISKMDIATHRVKRLMNVGGDASSLSNNFVFALHQLSPDSILVGTIFGADILNKKTGKFSRFRENELTDCFIYDIFSAPDGKIWISTYNRGLFIYDRKHRGLMTHYTQGDHSGLPCNSIISHCVDSHKRIWIGTRGGGLCLFHPHKQTFTVITSNKLLVNNVVYGIEEDKNGFFWLSSNKGISRLNLNDSTAIHFNYRHGIAGNQYNYKSYFKDNDGTIYFGSVSGLTSFNPDNIITPTDIPTVYFTNLRIFNEIIQPNTTGSLKKHIDFSDEINLKYNQNSFTLEFSSINYFDGDVYYQYYLDGLENGWSPPSEQMQANYTNLSPGEYVFHVRAVNKISKLAGNSRTITIIVSPPFWASWGAYLLYIVLFVVLFKISYRSYTNRQKEKVALTIEKIEKENLRLLHQHKMNFFTYISHEFKTPLSIIIASVELLFQKDNLQPHDTEETHQTIKRSAMRLLTLVNQLMEFRKIETDHAVIHTHKGDVVDFFNQIVMVYRPLLEKKGIELKIQVQYEITEIYYDFDKLEKIFTNLLTNAVKYTPQRGEITLELNIQKSEFYFSVKDSGRGLNPAQIERIFEVFYSEEDSRELVESSGIGLALTASLVKLLKGKIMVESEPGAGCKFIVQLPYVPHVESNAVYERQVSTSDLLEVIPIDSVDTDAIDNDAAGNFTIVVAEDNKDLLKLLSKKLREKYTVKSFENGQTAWEYIQNKTPDIVITDVMMPVMSGMELCENIKTNINLCHIPVIMLTAKTTNEARLEGLQVGADLYIPKPFSMEELEIVLNNLIKTQVMLKNRLVELARIEGFEMPTSNQEHAFIERIFAMIHQHIDESALDVQFLADKLNISRSGLHNKIKNIMDMSTTEFINTVRINKAKELMSSTEMTFSEIAYKVGYNDSAYFSRTFKKLTGKTPGEYKRTR